NVTGATNAAIAIGAVQAQTCTGNCVVIQLDGTPPAKVEGTTITFTATGTPELPPNPIVIKLDSFISGVTGRGLATLSDLQAGGVRTFLVQDFGGLQLDQVNCTGGGTCTVLYDDNNSNTKIGFTVTNLVGQVLADLHMH